MVTYGNFKYTKIFKDARDFYLYVYYPKTWSSNASNGGGYHHLVLSNESSGIDKIINLWMTKTTMASIGLSNPNNTITIPNNSRVFYRTEQMKTSGNAPVEITSGSGLSYNVFCSGGDYGTILELFVVDDISYVTGTTTEMPTTTISSNDPNDIIKNIAFDNEGNVTSITVDATSGTVTVSDKGKIVTSNGASITNTPPLQETPTETTPDTTDATNTEVVEDNKVQSLIDKIKTDPRGRHILIVVIIMIVAYILYKNRGRFLPIVDKLQQA